MRIRAILTDLDGTLLGLPALPGTLSRATEHTCAVIAACRAKGIRFIIATGRAPNGVLEHVALPDFDGAIYNNGAQGEVGGKPAFYRAIPPELLRRAVERFRSDFPNAGLAAETARGTYTHLRGRDADMLGRPQFLTSWAPPPEGVGKLLGFAFSHPLAQWNETPEYSTLDMRDALPPELSPTPILNGRVVECMAPGVDKGSGARALLAALGIPAGEAVAFGDDTNDIPLLRAVGIGVAMGNAARAVQEAADAVTGRFDEEGLADWLEKNAL